MTSPAGSLAARPHALEAAAPAKTNVQPGQLETREAFQAFVGQTLFGQMISSMRKSVPEPAYMHGGKGEEVFQKQLDQVLVEEMSAATADTISDPMFDLFMMRRG